MHEINFFHEHELAEHDFLGCCKDCQNSLAIIKPHIMGFADRIKKYSLGSLKALEPDALYQLYQILDDLAHMDAGPHLSGLILEEAEIRQQLPLIRSYYSSFFGIHEVQLAEQLIQSSDPWQHLANFPLYPRYESLVSNQVKAMQVSPGNRFVFLGSGPVPLTLILMSRLYGIPSMGLDADPETVALSRKVIRRLGLQKEIEIIQADDSCLEDLNWDIILVAALAEPKIRIFKHLREILEEQGRAAPVIFRTYTGMRAVLYKPVQPEDIRGFKIVKALAPTGQVNNTTVFMHIDT